MVQEAPVLADWLLQVPPAHLGVVELHVPDALQDVSVLHWWSRFGPAAQVVKAGLMLMWTVWFWKTSQWLGVSKSLNPLAPGHAVVLLSTVSVPVPTTAHAGPASTSAATPTRTTTSRVHLVIPFMTLPPVFLPPGLSTRHHENRSLVHATLSHLSCNHPHLSSYTNGEPPSRAAERFVWRSVRLPVLLAETGDEL